jgi:hypothetical protein
MPLTVKCLSGDLIQIPLDGPVTARQVKVFFHDTQHIHPNRQILWNVSGELDTIVDDSEYPLWLVLPQEHPLAGEYNSFLSNLDRWYKGEVFDKYDLDDCSKDARILTRRVRTLNSVYDYFDQHALFFDPALPDRLEWDSVMCYTTQSIPCTVMDSLIALFIKYDQCDEEMFAKVLDTVRDTTTICRKVTDLNAKLMALFDQGDIRAAEINVYCKLMALLQKRIPDEMGAAMWSTVKTVFESDDVIVEKLRAGTGWSREEMADLVKRKVLHA